MKLEEKTLDELKVMAYDQIKIRDIAQYNLNLINQEIQKREEVNNGYI